MQKTMTFTNQIPTLPQIQPPNLTSTKNPPQISHLFHLKPIKIQPLSLKPPPRKCTGGAFSQVNSHSQRECEDDGGDDAVGMRLGRLVSEFRALSEPIERVKRLLGYAAVLPRLGESTRSPENRVRGCAAQVWLEVVRDEFGRMRFGADSDSEITKGFCSCLIFLLDGAYPKDVLKVKAEDLTDMNVGLPVRSRVNSWHNVLVNMQERTKQFLPEKDQEVCQTNDSVDTFPSLVVPHDSIVSKGEVCVS